MAEELASRAGVAYGNWLDDTPEEDSRIRAIQRWRGSSKWSPTGPIARLSFPHLWPVGERQRQEVDASYQPSQRVSVGSWRVFLYNCGPDVVRDVKVLLDEILVTYSPSIVSGRFTELQWQKIDAIRRECLTVDDHPFFDHRLNVQFVLAKGTHEARLEGVLRLDPVQGWRSFASGEGRSREIE